MLDGNFVLFINGARFDLKKGDSFRFSGEEISWANEGDVDAELIWVITQPVYWALSQWEYCSSEKQKRLAN